MWIRAVATAALFGALTVGTATAAPSPTPTPGPASTSSSDEIADMVMDAIDRQAPPATPVPPPPPG
ncbi:hypothetical protein FHT40_001723 [Mycolicibacterium sp. BK556]|uniref:hypothetical protein n=1 Tax=Mycobacteriaceae TaxID=1762 RepID=UPI00105B56E9|nr:MULTISPECIES: hypothetical protein [Mycobacteriaceae]MBB3602090.1 hypothetical protein [Mycolicibacterium sp. BK556]MBB3631842.1 hypothetical protein [Mycolicibacterium sp. BK607]MBB3749846.1 hypothetical protein [Mycolicibacterium sp. BK634]TDO18866.1 hypothetical protein EV580_2056 [Mycobacterium sp. BK086]